MKIDNSIKNIPLKENSFTQTKNTQLNNVEIKMGAELQELEQAKQLWLDVSNTQSIFEQTKKQLDDRMALIYDGYDSYAKHLIVKDVSQAKVVAYARIIDSHTAYNIGGFFCETQFNLNKLRSQMQSALEVSRLVIDPDYRNFETLSLLWSGIMQYASEHDLELVFGTLTLALKDSHYSVSKEIKRLKSMYLASNKYRVVPYQILPPMPKFLNDAITQKKKFEAPAEVEYFFTKGAKLCGEPGWNKSFNQAELLFYIKPNVMRQLPQIVQQNETNYSGFVA